MKHLPWSRWVFGVATLLSLDSPDVQASTARWSAMSMPIALGFDVAVADRLPTVIAGATSGLQASAKWEPAWTLTLGRGKGVALGALTRPRELGVCAVAGSGSGGRLGASVLRVHKTEADSWDTTRMSDSERGYRTVLGLGWSGDGQASIDVAVEALVLDQSSESYFPGDPNFSRESNDKDPVWSARSLLRLPMLAGEGRAHLSWVSHDGSRTTRNRAGESRLRIEDDGFSGIADLAWVRELTGPGQAIVGVSLETHDDERRYLEPESLALFESRGRRLSWFAGVERSPRSWLTLRGGASQSHAWSWTRFRSHIRAERTAQSALSDPAPTLGVGFRSGALQIDLELQPERAFEDVLASLSIVARL